MHAPSPNVDFFTVAISVEETTEEINAHHFRGRVLYRLDQDNESDEVDHKQLDIAIDLSDYIIC